MILKSARVENFKCIEDSTEFSIDAVTCLVGKNESGKTALLEALRKLNPDIPDAADFNALRQYPRRKYTDYKQRDNTSPDNVLTTVWELEEGDIEAIAESLGPEALKNTTTTITKGYDNQLGWDIDIDEREAATYLAGPVEPSTEEETGAAMTEQLPAMVEKVDDDSEQSNQQAVEIAIDILEERLPTFLYFADYYKLLGRVSLNDLNQRRQEERFEHGHRVFLALLDLVGSSAQDIDRMGRYEELTAELEAVSNRITQDIFAYWSQNRDLEVKFSFEHARDEDEPPYNAGFVFHTRIYNSRHGVTVSFDERSAGFVWFFSFLVWFSQVKKTYGDNVLILLDDPGLSLHGRAQADLLRYINEKLSPNYQVIYTTHSPFMIDPDSLLSVRTVEDVIIDDRVQGTKVGDDVLSVDPDTVFPLQAALGYDITQTLFVGKHTLLVEGPGDLLYLKWFSNELRQRQRESLDSRWVVTPVGGVDKVFSFVALFGGRKLHVAVFTDYHVGVKGKVRSLKESDLLRKGHVFSAEMYVDQAEADTEDLIGRALYRVLVNECYSLRGRCRTPKNKPSEAPTRVIEEVQQRFRTMPPSYPEFDHYTPAVFLVENTAQLRDTLSDLSSELGEALDRFEKLFHDLNALLPKLDAQGE